jgi:hypothetical protein
VKRVANGQKNLRPQDNPSNAVLLQSSGATMMRSNCFIVTFSLTLLLSAYAQSQVGGAKNTAAQALPAPPPATKLEGFKPAAGSVLTIGYNDLGNVSGISVDVREMRDSRGTSVRGLVVEVTESEYREERSFVDADEMPELLKGFDALLGVKSNPTQFNNFEVRYTTRGELQLTAFNTRRGNVSYAVQAGRTLHAQRIGLSADDMQKLRDLFVAASQKLGALGSGR